MKIKLQEYSLISNEYLNKEIEHLKQIRTQCEGTAKDKIDMVLFYFERLTEQLIPSEKLASICLDKGVEIAFESINAETDKELFLISEIEVSTN